MEEKYIDFEISVSSDGRICSRSDEGERSGEKIISPINIPSDVNLSIRLTNNCCTILVNACMRCCFNLRFMRISTKQRLWQENADITYVCV